MRDIFATPPFVNGVALALGALTQFVIRYFADGYIERYSAEKISRISIMTMFVGLLCVCFALHPAIALLGFALMGAGNAVLFPLAVSAAAQRTDRPAAVNVASLAQVAFLAFLLAPPLLGFVAEQYGIRVSFALGLPLLLASWLTVKSVKIPTVSDGV